MSDHEAIPARMADEPHDDSPYAARPSDTPPHFPAPGAVFDTSYDPLRDYDQNAEPDEAVASVWSRRSFAQALLAAVHEREKEIAKAYADKLCEGSVSLIKLTVELERESAEEDRRTEERRAPTLAQALLPLLRRDLIPQKEAERKAAQAIKPWESPGYGQGGLDLKAMQENPTHRRLFPTRTRCRARLARPLAWRRCSRAAAHASYENTSAHAGHFSACATTAVALPSAQSIFAAGASPASGQARTFHPQRDTPSRRQTADRSRANASTGGTPPHGIRFRLRAAAGADRSRASRRTPQASPPAGHDGHGDVSDRAKPSSLHRRSR